MATSSDSNKSNVYPSGQFIEEIPNGNYRVVPDEPAMLAICRALQRQASNPMTSAELKALSATTAATAAGTAAGVPNKISPTSADKKSLGDDNMSSEEKKQHYELITKVANMKGPRRNDDQNNHVVYDPHPHDVLHGKGQHVSLHPGNLFFRSLVWKHKEEYEKCTK